MSVAPSPPSIDIISSDSINRIWQHGMHEEQLFHARLNYFSVLEVGLLSICGIMYNKQSAVGFFLPLTIVALSFTLLWLVIQSRHWKYCVHVNNRIKEVVPEYRTTVEGFAKPGRPDGLSISKPLALAVPTLFACTWIAFLSWLATRNDEFDIPRGSQLPERIVIAILCAIVCWLVIRVRRLEKRVQRSMK